MIVVRSAPLLLLLSLAIGTIPASAVDVPGGGPAKSDCYVGFEVDATPAPTVSGAKVTGKACGSACAFKVKACINETAVVSGCTAPNVTRVTIVPPAVGLQPPPTPGSTQACGPEATVSVPLKGKAHNRPGKKKLKMVATADAKPKKDVDILKLLCMPNPGDAGCGGAGAPRASPARDRPGRARVPRSSRRWRDARSRGAALVRTGRRVESGGEADPPARTPPAPRRRRRATGADRGGRFCSPAP